uniref:Uncharacterized protein n=1 Tax=Parascaris univalens TaxID=6257 RepID=A0A915BKS5_PARUN
MELDQQPSVKYCHDETLADIERANHEFGITMPLKLDRMALNFFSGCVRLPIRHNCGVSAWSVIFRVLRDTTNTLMPGCQFTGQSSRRRTRERPGTIKPNSQGREKPNPQGREKSNRRSEHWNPATQTPDVEHVYYGDRNSGDGRHAPQQDRMNNSSNCDHSAGVIPNHFGRCNCVLYRDPLEELKIDEREMQWYRCGWSHLI